MRASFMRLVPLVAAAAMMAGCGGTAGTTVPQAANNGSLQPAALAPATRTVQDRDHVTITCGTDEDDCKKIRLVAPLNVAFTFRGLSLSLTSTKCEHAHVRIDEDGGLPLSPPTWTSPRAGLLPVGVASMADPCAHHDRDGDLRHPMTVVTPTPMPTTVTGNTDYYVVALIHNTDGTYALTTIDGPAYSDGTTLSWSTPVLSHSVQGSIYAFYLARHRSDKDDQSGGNGHDGGDGGDHHGDGD